jgi:hypothetical protein
LLRARDHLDADATKIFEAVIRAMQADEARQQVDQEPASTDGDAP